jgi:hypothetical protein
MKYVLILKNNRPVWGHAGRGAIRTLLSPPYDTVAPHGRCRSLAGSRSSGPLRPHEAGPACGKNYHDHVLELHGDRRAPQRIPF